MAGLPPKPQDTPSQERPDSNLSYGGNDRRSSRPVASPQPRPYRTNRLNSPPPERRIGDSYIAPPYDGRRDAEYHRRDYDDRGRTHRERLNDREPERFDRRTALDFERNRRPPQRDSQYEGDRHYDRYRTSFDLPQRRGSPRRDGPFPMSGSHSRRKYSPVPQGRYPRSWSPGPINRRPRSRSPPSHYPPNKRLRMDEHTADTSTHSHSPHSAPDRHPHSRSCSPPSSRLNSPPLKRERTPRNIETVERQEPLSSILKERPAERLTKSAVDANLTPPPIKLEPEISLAGVKHELSRLSPPGESLNVDSQVRIKGEPEFGVPLVALDKKICERSSSPPRQPRNHASQPFSQTRRSSRSPPKGPRIHHKGNLTPTGPASLHPPGPRGQRRMPPPTSLPPTAVPPNVASSVSVGDQQPVPVPPEPGVVKVTIPHIPLKKPQSSLTPELDAEMARLQAHRAHLASEYTQLSKLTRRALHDLETASIDLRAAELRRRVAEAQHEKARNGVLGVDYVPMIDSF